MPEINVDVTQERLFYVTSKMLNNALLGVPREWLNKQMALADVSLRCDLDNCYLCLTGLARLQYLQLGESEISYFASEYTVKEELARLMRGAGYRYEMVYHGDTKEQCVLFTQCEPSPALSPARVAQRVHEIVGGEIARTMPRLQGRCCNFTVYSPHVDSYERLHDAFSRIQALKSLSFFYMKPVVFTPERLKELERPVTLTEIDDAVSQMEDMVMQGRRQAAADALQRLFLQTLKASFSMRMVSDACAALRMCLLRCQELHGFQLSPEGLEGTEPQHFCSIEELYRHAAALLDECADKISERPAPMSYVTRMAVGYIRAHIAEPLSLSGTAAWLRVTDSHLARTLKLDLGETFCSYVLRLRMKQAARALCQSDSTVQSVAASVGFPDAQYFHRVFRRYYGVTPQQYRQRERQERGRAAAQRPVPT